MIIFGGKKPELPHSEKCSYCGKKLRDVYKFNPFVYPTSYKCDRFLCDLLKSIGIHKIDIN